MKRLPSLPLFLLGPPISDPGPSRSSRGSVSFLEKVLVTLSRFLKDVYVQWDLSTKRGLLQGVDPRIKIAMLAVSVIVAGLKHELAVQAVLMVFLFSLGCLSRLDLRLFLGKILSVTMVFGVLLPLPSSLNIVTEGKVLVTLLTLESSKKLLWFQLPEVVGITEEGVRGVALIAMRVMNSITATFLVFHTTPFMELLRSLKSLRIPDSLIMIVALTYKYIFVMVTTVEQMHRAKGTRLIRGESYGDTRRWAAQRMAFIFQRAQARCEEIQRSMESRGFSGSIEVAGLKPLTRKELMLLGLVGATGIIMALA